MSLNMSLNANGTVLKFSGRDRLDAKRKALRFWCANRDMLHETMADFAKHCTLSPNQKVITYRRQGMR